MPLDDAVERFRPLDDGSGKFLSDTWTMKVVYREQMSAVLPAGERWDRVKRHPIWIDRGAYYIDEVGFDPAGNDPSVRLNTWRGWPMEPKKGKCEILLELIHYLCNRHQEGDALSKWLLQWMAYPLQHPGAKMLSAVIMHGPAGTGKSSIRKDLPGNLRRRICLFPAPLRFAQAASSASGRWRINSTPTGGRFHTLRVGRRSHQPSGDVGHTERTKRSHHRRLGPRRFEQVGKTAFFRGKMIAAYRQRNHMNIAFLSNEDLPLPIDNDDRRYLVIYTPPKLSEAFYNELWTEIAQGGIEAFYHYLLHLDLSNFNPKSEPPGTVAKRDLAEVSKQSEDQFIEEWMGQADNPYPFGPCGGKQLYLAYTRWCRANGIRFPRNSIQFLNRVGKMPGWLCGNETT